MPTYSLLKYIMRSLRARLTPLHLKKMINREKVSPQKWDFFLIFLDTLLKNCLVCLFCSFTSESTAGVITERSVQEREICLLSLSFALFVANNVYKKHFVAQTF